MKNKKFFLALLLVVFFTALGITWKGAINSGKWAGALNFDSVRAAVLNEISIPIVFNGELIETIFGVEMYDMTVKGGLQQMNAAGITWIRHNDLRSDLPTDALIWAAVENSKGARNWNEMSGLETQLKNAVEFDKKVILIVRSTPKWASLNDQSPCGPIKPSEYAAFADFMYDAVKRYSDPKYNVKYWELYNEPDYPLNTNNPPFGEPHGCWGNASDPYNNGEAYGDMLNVVYPKIKEADPEAKVLIGGLLLDCDPRPNQPDNKSLCELKKPTYTSQPNFLEGILLSGAGNSFDGVSFHAYDYFPYWPPWSGSFGVFLNEGWGTNWNTTGPVVIKKTEFIKEVLTKYSITGKELYNTESALLHTSSIYENSGICDDPVDTNYENTKASHIVQTYALAKALGLKANIYFHAKGWRCSALIDHGNQPIQPGYDSYSFTSEKLRYSTFENEILSYGPNVKAYEFQNDGSGRKLWVIWSLDGANYPITLPSKPSKIWYFDGTPQSFSGTSFTVKLEPHFIEY